MKTNEEYIQSYLDELRISRKSVYTIKNYKSQLFQFDKFINKSFAEVKREDIVKFLDGELEIATKHLKQSVICNFYNWMSDYDYVVKHPMMSKLTFGAETKLVEFLEEHEINKINELLRSEVKKAKKQNDKYVKDRNYTIFNFMIGTGVRSSEVLGIKLEDLNLEKNEVIILRKRGKKQLISFKYNLGKILEAYIKRNNIQTGYLFSTDCVLFATKMSKQNLDKIFKHISDLIGKHIHPHMTRSTYAMIAVDNGMNPLDLQKQLGHANPATTQIYFEIRNKRLKDAVNQFAPDMGEVINQ